MPIPSAELVKSIISLKHAEYVQKVESWKLNEKRFAGGEDVFEDLRQFQWEAENTTAFGERKNRAVWPGFGEMTAEKFVGSLFAKFPEEGSGLDLGNLRTSDQGIRADMLLENADGIGHDARSLYTFWFEAMQRAMSTKRRWILAEAPAEAPGTLAREIEGLRPYFVEYSPVDVPYWFFSRGQLQCLRIEIKETVPRLKDGKVEAEETTTHYLMTRQGFEGWGDDFKAGGWWMFDGEGEILRGVDGRERMGDWQDTGGQIPMTVLYYERGFRGDRRTGITHIGRIDAAFMDLLSALMNDAWESGSGVVFFGGVSYGQWDTIVTAGKDRAKWVPVPGVEGGGQVQITSVAEGKGAEVLADALDRLVKLAMQIIARELVTSPDASGRAREIQHVQGSSPRLATMAANIEEAMNTAHRFLERRWGFPEPTFKAEWPRTFDLRSIADKISQLLEMFTVVDAQAPALFADMLVTAAKSEGLISGEAADLKQIRAEIEASFRRQPTAPEFQPTGDGQ